MSKSYWQIRKQAEHLPLGLCVTDRARAWVAMWRKRCYSNDIPDQVPDGLLYSGRVPSWKAIALAILRNDLQLRALGFSRTYTAEQLRLLATIERLQAEEKQLNLFHPTYGPRAEHGLVVERARREGAA
jgi:hypothetical protein